jgi:hypothetical protein
LKSLCPSVPQKAKANFIGIENGNLGRLASENTPLKIVLLIFFSTIKHGIK